MFIHYKTSLCSLLSGFAHTLCAIHAHVLPISDAPHLLNPPTTGQLTARALKAAVLKAENVPRDIRSHMKHDHQFYYVDGRLDIPCDI